MRPRRGWIGSSRLSWWSSSKRKPGRSKPSWSSSGKKREAVACGDTETYDRLRKEENQFYQNLAQSQPQQPQRDEALLKRWMDHNPWMSNPLLAGKAHAIAERLSKRGITGQRQLDAVEAEIKENYSDLVEDYGTDARSPKASKPARKRDWASIPAADRKLLTDQYFKSRGVARLPDTDAMRCRLAKSYWDSNFPED